MLYRLEQIAQWTPDADDIANTKKHQSKWLLSASPDGLWTLLVQDDIALLWNDTNQSEVQLGQIKQHSTAWSYDSKYVAICQQDGRINIIQVSSASICYSILGTFASEMVIVDPSAYAGQLFNGVRYQYELLVFSDKEVRSFLFSDLQEFTVAIRVGESSLLVHQHSFKLLQVNQVVADGSMLVLGGSQLSVIKLVAKEPFYQMVCQYDAKPGGQVLALDLKDGQLLVLWQDGEVQHLDLSKDGSYYDKIVWQRKMDAELVMWWDKQSYLVVNDGQVDIQRDGESLLEGSEQLSKQLQIVRQKGQVLTILELVQQYAICKLRNIKGVVNVQVVEIADKDKLKVPLTLTQILKTWFVDKIRPLSYIVNAVTGVHLVDDVDTTTKEFTVPLRTFNLLEFTESSPQNLLQAKLNSKQFDEALLIAAKYNLSKDQVYKEQWNSLDVTADTIQNVLGLVMDKNWQVEQCLSRVCQDAFSQKLLYNHGLAITDIQSEIVEGISGSSIEIKLGKATLTQEQQKVVDKRSQLLELLKRLEIYTKLSFDNFEKVYIEFYQLDMFHFCVYSANRSQFEVLDVVLPYYRFNSEQAFEILDALPEVVDFSIYPKYFALASSEALNDQQDWSLAFVKKPTYKEPSTTLDQWLKQRVYSIDSRSGCLQDCMLEDFLYDPICREFKVAAVELPDKLTMVSLQAFDQMSPVQQVELLLQRGIFVWRTRRISEVFVSDVVRYVLKFEDLGPLSKVLENELELAVKLLKVSDKVASIVAGCIVQCSKDDQFEYIQEFCELVPKGQVDRQLMYDIENMLSVAEELEIVGIRFSPVVLLKLPVDVQQQKKVLTRMSRIPLNSPQDLDSVNELLEAMVHIQEVSCPGVKAQEVEKLLLQALLSSESMKLIDIARQLMFPAKKDSFYHQLNLVREDIQQLIIQVAQGYFDNAQSGSLQGLLKYCLIVLDLPISFAEKDILREYVTVVLKLCEDHHVLSESGIPMIPLEIKLEQDVVQLLCRAQALYQKPETVAYFYQVLTKGQHIEAKDLDLIEFEGAIRNEDFEVADKKLDSLNDRNLALKFIRSIKTDQQRKRAYDLISTCQEKEILQLAQLLPEL